MPYEVPDKHNPYGRCQPEPGRWAVFLITPEGHLEVATRGSFRTKELAYAYCDTISRSHGAPYVVQIPHPVEENPNV